MSFPLVILASKTEKVIKEDAHFSVRVCCGIDSPINLNDESFLAADLKVFLIKEVLEYSCIQPWIIENQHHFDIIITTQKIVMDALDVECVYIPFATRWVWESVSTDKKSFEISYLPGKKFIPQFPGHHMRRKVYSLLSGYSAVKTNNGEVPLKLFDPNVYIPSKLPVFENSQYSIIIENVLTPGWFTEKIVDAIITKTIPIYYGDPHIGDIYDSSGIITFSTIPELIEIIQSLTPDIYPSRLSVINKNAEICKKYVDFNSRFYNILKEKIETLL